MAKLELNRRDFVVSVTALGGGMMLAVTSAEAGFSKILNDKVPWGPDAAAGNELTAWVAIGADDSVTIRVPTPENGNGAMTQIAMNVTEELGCAWKHVRVEFASIQRDALENKTYTAGFLPFFSGHATDKGRMNRCLQVGASARERLKAAAAARWNVPVAEILAADSVLRHAASGRTLRYGDVALDAAKITLATEPKLKELATWNFIGKASPPKLHIPQIADGSAVYGVDVKLPGMVHAALMQSPVMGGKLVSFDAAKVMKMPGVRAVVAVDPAKTVGTKLKNRTSFGMAETAVQHAVAVIADHFWQAKMALEALPVVWDAGAGAQWDDASLAKGVAGVLDSGAGSKLSKSGDVALATGKRVIEREYATPYCDNAVMEPLNATALVRVDGAEVWCPTQDMMQAFWVAIDETGLSPETMQIHQTYMGGGFGRRTQAEEVRMAVAIARQYPGVPVKLIWTREEMFRQGRYRTPITTRFKAVLDDTSGLPQAVSGTAAFTGTRPLFQLNQGYSDVPYFTSGIIPNIELRTAKLPVHILNGAYRGPCYNSHTFITETFVDECAHEAGIDPLEYRLKLLSKWDAVWSDCLRLAAKKAGWGKALPKGEGLGIAITSWPTASMRNSSTVVCAAVRVAVSPAGELRVKTVDVALDCGRMANKDAVLSAAEGGIIFGLNMTLNEGLSVKDGAVVEGNFDEYPMLRMADMPKLRVHFDAMTGQDRMDIIGESTVGPVGPAVGNAIFAATGKRVRTTPFRKVDLSWR